jgi:hypothetical protein
LQEKATARRACPVIGGLQPAFSECQPPSPDFPLARHHEMQEHATSPQQLGRTVLAYTLVLGEGAPR